MNTVSEDLSVLYDYCVCTVFVYIYNLKFLRFAFGGKAYQYRALPFGLELSPRTFVNA